MNSWTLHDQPQRERIPLLKKLFWAYFLLLFFEGALRKWVVPQFSLQLLLIRDPIALAILWESYRTRKWPREWAEVVGILTLAFLALCMLQVIVSELPWYIALYGLRSYLLPFPVAFVMGANLTYADLRKFGRCTLWLMLPLTAVQIAQYYAPSDSLLNKGAFAGAAQIASAGGHVRASATFSFVSGPIHYLPLAAAFVVYGIIDRKFVRPKMLIWASTAALLIAVPVTGSRTVVYEMAAVILVCMIAAFAGISEIRGALRAGVVILAIAALVIQLPLFSDSLDTLSRRFTEASGSEGDTRAVIKARITGPVGDSIDGALSTNSWLGLGAGYGSNFASHSKNENVGSFVAGENEWPRVISEFGPFFGIAFMLFRLMLCLLLASRALGRIRERQPLGWFLMAATVPGLVFEILEQPTIQGFVVITVAFVIAALNRENFEAEALPDGDLAFAAAPVGAGTR